MKYKYFRLLLKVGVVCVAIILHLACVLLIFLLCVYYLSSIKRYYSYTITDIYMREVIIDNDSALSGKKTYLIGADVQKEDYKWVCRWGVDRYPFVQSSDSICDISVETQNDERLNDNISLLDTIWGHSLELMASDKDTVTVSYGEGARYMLNDFMRRKIQPNNNIIVVLEDSVQRPAVIRLKLADRAITHEVTNEPPEHYHMLNRAGGTGIACTCILCTITNWIGK